MGEAAPSPTYYDQPTVMWRMYRADGCSAHAVIGLRGGGAWVMWFMNDRPLGRRDFEDWGSAIQWSDRMRAQNWATGWRLSTDGDDGPTTES